MWIVWLALRRPYTFVAMSLMIAADTLVIRGGATEVAVTHFRIGGGYGNRKSGG